MASSGGKKSGICRYFAQNGECFYGHDCQFIHSRGGSGGGGGASLSSSMLPQTMIGPTIVESNAPSSIPQPVPPPPSSLAPGISVAGHNPSVVDDPSQLGNPVEQLPERVVDYIDLCPLQSPSSGNGASSLGFVTSIYRATNIETNQYVCMRRVHAFQSNPANSKSLLDIIDAWKKIQCANVVRLLQVFTTRAFGDNSLVFIYQYYPQSTTLMQQYFSNSSASGPGLNGFATNRPYSQQQAILKNKLLPENLLWHYIIQISSAIRLIHSQGLAYRVLDPSKVLITTTVPNCPPYQLQPTQYPRIRLNTCGMFDIVTHDLTIESQASNPKAYIQQLQQEDLISIGRLCVSLATCSLQGAMRDYWQQSVDLISRTYSGDLRNLIVTLLSKQPNTNRTINDVMPMIGARFYVQLNLAYEKIDATQAELDREALNGRLLRLLVKLGMINERPELRMDTNWSETGDRYMLKLFRDYIFHQLNEDGTPWLDMGHVVSTLVKFDVGSPEKICLISRDENHVLVVSFAELKKCFENALMDLTG
ncbi:PAN2-PAN3 deadenylation complex subunit pan3, partial [Fragariocoptes setiger]